MVFILTLLFMGAGFFFQFWPLEILALLVAAFGALPALAIGVGLMLDIIFGTPLGIFHYLYFPFTLVALIAVAARAIGSRFMIDRYSHNTL